MKVVIPMEVIERAEEQAKNSFVSELPFENEGYITLYDKNSNANHRFKNPKKLQNMRAFVAEIDEIPKYFSKVIILLNH